MYYAKAAIITILAWIAGLFLDANISWQPQGFLCLRILLPVLAMGLCIIYTIKQYEKDKKNSN